MKKMYFSVVAMFMFLLFTGCASMGSLDSSGLSSDFQPKEQYAVNYNKAWDAVTRALFNAGIVTVTSDKSSGQIVTDYIDGGTQYDPLQGVITRRFKFSISVGKIDANTTSVKIFGRLETMTERVTWHDVTVGNKKQVANRTNLIYQKIETELNK